jgi:hypothetical protein
MPRLQIVPLSEGNIDWAVPGEIVIDPSTGHISTKDSGGHIQSVTKSTQALANSLNLNTYKKTETYTQTEIEDRLDQVAAHGQPMIILEEAWNVNTATPTDLTTGFFTFTLTQGWYPVAENRMEVYVNDTTRLTASNGGIVEIDTKHFRLNLNVNLGDTITARYYQNLGQQLMDQHGETHMYGGKDYVQGIPVVSQTEPNLVPLYAGMIWIK